MHIAVDEKLLDQITKALRDSTQLLIEAKDREGAMNKELFGCQLISEAEAADYLGRDIKTLRYYKKLGLEPYKKGKECWYLKGDINAWLESGKVNRHKR